MSTTDFDVFQKLRAYDAGRAIDAAETLPWPRASREDALVLAFVRMGGEALPWGVAFGRPGETPRVLSVADPRDVSSVGDMLLALGDALFSHFEHPVFARASATGRGPARQLWVPGASHLEALHLLALRFARTQHGESRERIARLRALGRLAGWLFRESSRCGQIRVFDASARLRECFAFPAETVRQQHLGFLLAWARPGDATREARVAMASDEEFRSVSWTLDPELEARTLAPLLERPYGARIEPERAERIAAVLAPELLRRWALIEETFELFAGDPRASNPYLEGLVKLSGERYAWGYVHREADTTHADLADDGGEDKSPNQETDHRSRTAAAGFFQGQHSESAEVELAHGDRVRFARSVYAGEALEGTVTRVEAWREGRKKLACWTVEAPAALPTKLREGSQLAQRGYPGRTFEVVSIAEESSVRRFVLGVTKNYAGDAAKGVAPVDDTRTYTNARMGFVAQSAEGIALRKCMAVHAEGPRPGGWLTDSDAAPRSVAVGARTKDLLESGEDRLRELEAWR